MIKSIKQVVGIPKLPVSTKRQRKHSTSYSNRAWVNMSYAWIARYPICVLCLVRGEVNRGALENPSKFQRSLIVDHIQPHRQDEEKFWDTGNLETLCRMPCHDVFKQRHEQACGTGQAWLDLLHAEMITHGTRQAVEELREFLPPHIVERLL